MGGAQQPMGTGSYFMPAMQVPPNNFMPRPAMIRGVTPRWGSSPQVSYINILKYNYLNLIYLDEYGSDKARSAYDDWPRSR